MNIDTLLEKLYLCIIKNPVGMRNNTPPLYKITQTWKYGTVSLIMGEVQYQVLDRKLRPKIIIHIKVFLGWEILLSIYHILIFKLCVFPIFQSFTRFLVLLFNSKYIQYYSTLEVNCLRVILCNFKSSVLPNLVASAVCTHTEKLSATNTMIILHIYPCTWRGHTINP